MPPSPNYTPKELLEILNASFILSTILSTLSVAYSLVSIGTFGRPNFVDVDKARRKLFKARAEGRAWDPSLIDQTYWQSVILSPLKSLIKFLYPGLLPFVVREAKCRRKQASKEHPLTEQELEAVHIFESHLLSCQRKGEIYLGLSLIALLPGIMGLSQLLIEPHYQLSASISYITGLLAVAFFFVIGFSLYYGAEITKSARELIKREASIP
jgi:hypothetical protein